MTWRETQTTIRHWVKGDHTWSFSGPYFPAFGLNTETSGDLEMQMWKNANLKNSKYGHFSCSEIQVSGSVKSAAILGQRQVPYFDFNNNRPRLKVYEVCYTLPLTNTMMQKLNTNAKLTLPLRWKSEFRKRLRTKDEMDTRKWERQQKESSSKRSTWFLTHISFKRI